MNELSMLIEKAEKIYRKKFSNRTWFERALFFSWSCSIRDCTFCYMSTQQRNNDYKKAVRSKESLYAETILCKKLGWKIGFFSGGINSYPHKELLEILKIINSIIGEKIWLNIGPIPKKQLENYQPYIKGIIGSIETVNEKIHSEVCPSKPIKPYLKMFKNSRELGLKNGMTLILGLGESKVDFKKLESFIKKNNIEKIHVYALNPVKETVFERKKSPTKEYQAWYIAKIRTSFPKIDIQMGIWKDKINRVSLLLRAGANSISKFPITKKFGSEKAKNIELEAKKAKRKFSGTLTKLPNIDWNKEIEKLTINNETKQIVKKKLEQYLKKMS
jgi:biotin synthase-like enzyme|tara:strand:+ start:178 stop:1170 length:993 start_codon:yes stop_codon:yes gene_type:complete